ncbi:MAG: zinc ABC transporter substrate-binding protein, partial [Chloroflexi bacterium]|nr:zinc ABC transporter substrate-binding protein [Chloroflexota bacterium]
MEANRMAASKSGLKCAWAISAALLLTVLLGVACSGDGDQGNGRLRVVTSLELFADMVRNVAGDRAVVTALLPSGADPHTYELSPGRVVDVARADLA